MCYNESMYVHIYACIYVWTYVWTYVSMYVCMYSMCRPMSMICFDNGSSNLLHTGWLEAIAENPKKGSLKCGVV